jgi:hypothetical protein
MYELTLNFAQTGEVPPLASLSLRLCKEAEDHVEKLEDYCRELLHNANREG